MARMAGRGTLDRSPLSVACDARVVRRSLKIAVIVGTVLMAINHGDTIMFGEMSARDWAKCTLTFLVPYGVSTVTSVLAAREASG